MRSFSDSKYISAYKLNDNAVRLMSASGNKFDVFLPNKIISVSASYPIATVICETQVGDRPYTICMKTRRIRAH